jgi:sucrose phosphorylase
MADQRVLQLLMGCERRGGLISHRRLSNGEEVPYEINISWWSAMADGGIDPGHHQRSRFLLTQLLVMALPGIPAFYLPALLATPNDLARFRRTGHRRDLNRPQFRLDAMERRLQDPDADATNVLAALRHALEVRSSQHALHPDAAMTVLSSDRSDLVILKRSRDDDNALYAVHNITPNRLTLSLAQLKAEFDNGFVDCLSGQSFSAQQQPSIEPYAVHWLVKP